MKHPLLPILLIAMFHHWQAVAQQVLKLDSFALDTSSEGVYVMPVYEDSLCSSFLVRISDVVPLHMHRWHTEHVTVLEGTGELRLGEGVHTIGPGDVVVIPMGTPHAVRSTGDLPLRVLSVQSPRWDTRDRVPLE